MAEDMSTIIFVVEMIGTVAFALSGVMSGIKKQLDILGVVVLGTVTAVGGGVLRDICLGVLPPMLFQKPVYAIVAIGTSVLSFIVAYCMGDKFPSRIEKLNPVINVLDAIGLGIFVIVGVNAAINSGFFNNPFLAVFVGTITGVGGGLIRDKLVGEIPMVLQKRVYALAATVGALLYYTLMYFNVQEIVAVTAGAGVVVLIRMLATIFKWNLPRIRPG